ncbi:cytochrome b subunit of the bc complex [Candidatus Methanoperedens nitroreducens]|uniref:Cytochrome b subunit of the bc complex n=1 Tax=Candidatus Methanoperedens nitratireducens TaxID=1392998 RepID=A0A062V723_9EURY|nr:cytochrome b N-terminal domain-containing protein [Candidatus Methanoperedens nitroreducens]KCZ71205.1 cytochrome b subunit of the bc complex [Candidatus Methanoperedens nitroreducens]MDJ1421415.1 cytochrome b N-terminal domain-containing protein [Candidatus Methanoperedens sp.]
MDLADKIYKWLDDRFKLRELLPPIVKHPAPENVISNPLYCLGGTAFLCFLILVVTGIFLAMYYKPTPEEAYKSVEHIMTEVPFGSLIRSMHHWAANVMIAAVMLHMIRIYFMGAYKKPRELNWVVGIFLLLITTTFGFSGYLLPWDQLAFWATKIGTGIAGSIPVMGEYISLILMGESDIGAETLTRFFALHVLILPATIVALLGLHFMMVRIQGISGRL